MGKGNELEGRGEGREMSVRSQMAPPKTGEAKKVGEESEEEEKKKERRARKTREMGSGRKE